MNPVAIVVASLLAASGQGEASAPVVISNLPKDLVSEVYEGDDATMPVDDRFVIALTTRAGRHGDATAPLGIRAAFEQMKASLPRWYVKALRDSHGEDECSVVVNGKSYSYLVNAWFGVRWGLYEDGSPLRTEFERLEIRSGLMIDAAFSSGFCEYVKHGADVAMKHVLAYRTGGAAE
ncbi:hypothetical protein ACQQ2N_14285 [Dokdonella sp. MW10]|uniref:hypothetical protein n=1 Tax=Dokdonella sp. MW10 TaxID=2992926 RepID=UPI003F7E9EC0